MELGVTSQLSSSLTWEASERPYRSSERDILATLMDCEERQ